MVAISYHQRDACGATHHEHSSEEGRLSTLHHQPERPGVNTQYRTHRPGRPLIISISRNDQWILMGTHPSGPNSTHDGSNSRTRGYQPIQIQQEKNGYPSSATSQSDRVTPRNLIIIREPDIEAGETRRPARRTHRPHVIFLYIFSYKSQCYAHDNLKN